MPAKKDTYSPELSPHASKLMQEMGLPIDVARKSQGQLQISTFKALLDRGLDYQADYTERKASEKQQDKAIARLVAEREHSAEREHADHMALLDLDYNEGLSDDQRLLLGVETKDEKLERKQSEQEKSNLQEQVKELKEMKARLEQQLSEATGGPVQAANPTADHVIPVLKQ